MKRVLLLLLAITTITFTASAGDKNKKKPAADKKATAEAATENEIHWMTLDEVQVAMRKQPKKVLIDFYTGWCGWCKVMDRKTYSNPEIIKYVNDKFYAVKFDAERKDTVAFLNKEYGFQPEIRANGFAALLLGSQMSYPTTVFMMENFQNPQAVPGYQAVPQMEGVLKYLGENRYQSQKWDEYQKEFKPEFKEIPEAPPTPGGVPVSPH
jgi:thioredoxin-related protein